jgi:hypothetical protein
VAMFGVTEQPALSSQADPQKRQARGAVSAMLTH